jgi:hypothetical protein
MLSRPKPVTLAEAERDHTLKALTDSDWVVGGKSGAAATFGRKKNDTDR